MRKSLAALCFLIIVGLPGTSFGLGVELGAEAIVLQPGEGLGTGLGVGLRAKMDLGFVVLTGRAGYIRHLEEAGSSPDEIPVMIGLRYQLPLPLLDLYAGVEGGPITIKNGSTDTNIGIYPHIGAGIGKLDATLGYYVPDASEFADGNANAVMLTVGYSFISLP